MAETEEVIVDAQIEGAEEGEEQIENLSDSVAGLVALNKQLTETNKQLETQGKKNSKEYTDNAKQIDANKQAIGKNTAERKNLVNGMKDEEKQIGKNKMGFGDLTDSLDKIIPGLGGAVNGIKDFTAAGLRLLATPIGLILLAIAAALASVAVWFQRTEAGGDALAKMMAQLGAAVNVVLDRVAAFGGGLVALFTGDVEAGLDSIQHAFDDVGTEIEKEVQIAGELTDILDDLEDRERSYRVAASETTNEIKNLIIESKNRKLSEEEKIALLQQAHDLEVSQNEVISKIRADQLNATIKQIEQDFSQLNLTKEKGETDMEYAIRIVNNAAITGAARDKVADAIEAVNEVEGKSLDLQDKLINMIDQQNIKQEEKKKKAEEVRQKEDEIALKDYQEYQTRLQKDNELHQQITDNIADKEKKEFDTKAKLFMARTAETLEKATAEDERARKEREVKDRLIAQDEEDAKKRREAFTAAAMATLDVTADISGKIAEIRTMRFKNEMDSIELQKRAEEDALKEKLDNGLISQEQYDKDLKASQDKFAAEQLALKRKAFEDNKKNQIVQTTIDTIQSAAAAFRALAGIPIVGPALGLAAAAAALVYGYKKVDEIRAQQFVGEKGGQVPVRGGGFATIGGRRHTSGGTKFYGQDGSVFELESGEGMFVLNRSAHANFLREQSMRNQKYGGRSWFGGGGNRHFESGGAVFNAGAQQQGITVQEMAQVFGAVVAKMPRPVVAVETIAQKTAEQVDVVSKADLL